MPYRAVRRNLGLWGEYLTFCCLRKLGGYKKFLFNCYVPKENGGLTEIDLILLHGSGVYVLESKNYSGWIFGDERDQHWTQSFPGGRKTRFFNPIKQNNAHIRQLRRWLPELAEDAVQSIIVFSERCELKNITLTTHKHVVVKRGKALRAIRSFVGRKALSPTDIDAIYQRLYPQTQLCSQSREAHRLGVEDVVEGRVCAYCGAPLVLRTAKQTGKQFLGCGKFPHCRYTIHIP